MCRAPWCARREPARPRFSVIGSDPDLLGAYEDIHRHPGAETIPGVLIIRPDAPLFYANSQALRDTLTEMVRSSKDTIGTLILDLDANDELDITSTEALAKVIEELDRHDVRVALAQVHATAVDMIRRSASDGNPGPDRFFPNLDSAVTWASTSPVSSVPRAEEE
jgi:sulfate permease, SulP family